MSTPTTLTWLFLAALVTIAGFGIALYRASANFPERRLQIQISLFVQLLGSIVFAAIVTYSIYVIEHAQQAEETRIGAAHINCRYVTAILLAAADLRLSPADDADSIHLRACLSLSHVRFLHPHPRHQGSRSTRMVHEVKYDGYRLRVERDDDRVKLIARNGYDWTKR